MYVGSMALWRRRKRTCWRSSVLELAEAAGVFGLVTTRGLLGSDGNIARRRPRPPGAEANVAAHHVRPRGAPLCSTPRPGPGTAVVMNDRSPWPRSSRGPAAVPSICGDQFQCRTGSSCRKGAVSDGARHRRNIALFIGRLLVVPDAPRCVGLKGAMFVRAAGRRWRPSSEGFSIPCPQHLGSTGSGTVDKARTTPSPACPRRCRCRVPRTHADETSPDSKASRPRAVLRRTFLSRSELDG